MRPYATSTRGLQLLVYEALSYQYKSVDYTMDISPYAQRLQWFPHTGLLLCVGAGIGLYLRHSTVTSGREDLGEIEAMDHA